MLLPAAVYGRYIGDTDVTAPPAPEAVGAIGGDGQVELSWSAVFADDVAGYRVYRTAGDGLRVRLGPDPIEGTEYFDSSGVPGQEYSYTVTSVDDDGNESEPSEAVIVAQEATPTSSLIAAI